MGTHTSDQKRITKWRKFEFGCASPKLGAAELFEAFEALGFVLFEPGVVT